MAVTTKKTFPATTNATTTVFSPVSIQLNNQDDLDVYVTLSGGTRVLQLRQSTGSTAQSSHPQVNNTDGLYFPAVSAGTTLYNYQLSTDNNTITFNSALPQGAVVFCERRTRDADSAYTSFASGSTIRATDLNNSATESNFTAQDARNKVLEIENAIFSGAQPTIDGVPQPYISSTQIIDGAIATADIADNAITNAKMADDSVGAAELVDTSVGTAALASNAVTNAKMADASVGTSELVNDAVTTVKIANSQVTTAKISNGDVTTAKIAADAITNAKIPYHRGITGFNPGNPIIILGETDELFGICQASVACHNKRRNIRIIIRKTVTTHTSPTRCQKTVFCDTLSMKSLPQSVLHIKKDLPQTSSILYFSKYPSLSAHLAPVIQAIRNKAKVYQPKNKQKVSTIKN